MSILYLNLFFCKLGLLYTSHQKIWIHSSQIPRRLKTHYHQSGKRPPLTSMFYFFSRFRRKLAGVSQLMFIWLWNKCMMYCTWCTWCQLKNLITGKAEQNCILNHTDKLPWKLENSSSEQKSRNPPSSRPCLKGWLIHLRHWLNLLSAHQDLSHHNHSLEEIMAKYCQPRCL